MSLKNDDGRSFSLSQKKRKKVWSITKRFTFLYVVSVAILLFLAVGYLYWTLKQSIEFSRLGLLQSKVEVLRKLISEQPRTYQALVNEVEHEADSSYPIKYYIRILNEDGKTVMETPGFKDNVPVEMFPQPVSEDKFLFDSVKKYVSKKQSFLFLSTKVAKRGPASGTNVLQIAVDVTTGNSLLSDYSRKLLLVLVLGLIFSTFVGWWLARKGIQPLIDITQRAQHISATNLNERISVSSWPAELAELATAFNSMLDRLQEAFSRLSEFSANLAHELRTPINNLRGEAEVALSRCRTPEEYQHVLYSSLDEYQRISTMIESLLFLARADNPNAVIERTLFDARKEIESVCEFYEALAEEQNVNITIHGSGSLYADQALFRRVINNLLDNALRHTPSGGKIDIHILPQNNKEVEIRVSDTGEGIAPEHLPKIFDRFYRTDNSRLAGKTGAGLGLAIVKSIMNLHKGSVNIQSQLGKGTTVILKFPSSETIK